MQNGYAKRQSSPIKRGKGFRHPAVKMLLLINLLVWGFALYIWYNRRQEIKLSYPPPQISERSGYTKNSTDTSDSSTERLKDSVQLVNNIPTDAPTAPIEKEKVVPAPIPAKEETRVNNKTPIDKTAAPVNDGTNEMISGSNQAKLPGKIQYTLSSGETHFYTRPDFSTRRRAFINHWNKAVINPIREENGFIYIVYKNHQGQVSKGWLSKKDLKRIEN
ncbi:MAG TPA: hypothetical protein VM012_11845 [Flavitalea sp.]|nr:hypothetical protein [Flavitalea sp.]